MTIKDLAAQTGYSVGTVSRVLNHQPHVSDQAREVILRAAREAEFQLNSNAKNLKQQQGNVVLVICKGTCNELFDALLMTLQTRAVREKVFFGVDYIDESENEVRRALRLCMEKKPLGILFLGGNQENFRADFHQIQVPCVLVTTAGADLPFENLSSVSSDDAQAAFQAVDHLASLGHRNIVVIGGQRAYSDITRTRFEGCVRAFRDHGMELTEDRYEAARFSYEDGYRAAGELLQRHPDFTAVFAMSDVMAIGAVRALRDAGKRVPEEVSVVGFDGLNVGEFIVPRLTTMAQSVQTLADRALDLILSGIRIHAPASHEILPATLLHRESTRHI